MLLGGDERGRTQDGNNNAYCQDNEISWLDWRLDERRRGAARVHAAADPAPAATIRCSGARPSSRGEPTSGGLPDVWWFRPDGRKMTRRDWESAAAAARGLPQRRRSSARATPHGEPVVDDSFLVLFNAAPRGGRPSRCRRAASAAAGRSSSRPPTRTRRRRSFAGARRGRARVARALVVLRRERDRDARPRATYRLQLRPDFGFADARALVPYLRELGVSHLYLSPVLQARRGSTHGYDVVDPTRVSDELGGEAALRALCRAHGLGVILDIVPNHMAASDENPFWRDPELRRRFFDLDPATGRTGASSTSTSSPASASRTRRSSRRPTRSCSARRARGSSTACASTTPTASPTRAATSSGCAPRGAARIWVEKILEPGERAARLAGRGHDRLRVPERRAGALRRPGRRGARSTELAGEPRPWSRGRVRGEARAGRRRRSSPRSSGCGGCSTLPELDARARLAARLPHLRRAVDRPGRRGRPRGARAASRTSCAASCCSRSAGHDEFVTRFQQTTGAGHGQGRRGHRPLPLRPAARAQRGRRRSGPLRARRSTSSMRANLERAARFPHALLAGTTHDTKRSADVRARIGALAGIAERWREHARAGTS